MSIGKIYLAKVIQLFKFQIGIKLQAIYKSRYQKRLNWLEEYSIKLLFMVGQAKSRDQTKNDDFIKINNKYDINKIT